MFIFQFKVVLYLGNLFCRAVRRVEREVLHSERRKGKRFAVRVADLCAAGFVMRGVFLRADIVNKIVGDRCFIFVKACGFVSVGVGFRFTQAEIFNAFVFLVERKLQAEARQNGNVFAYGSACFDRYRAVGRKCVFYVRFYNGRVCGTSYCYLGVGDNKSVGA